MFRRIIVTALLGSALLFTTPAEAHADKRGNDDHKEATHPGRDGARDDDSRHTARESHDRGEHHDRGDFHDRDGRYDDYYRYYGYDDGYYRYYGYRCNGYRDGYYYDRYGRPYYYGGRPYYRRNADCDWYYRHYGYWYGDPYCDRYEFESGYCG